MFEIMVEETFSAAHQLSGYDGKCEKLHGHNWRVQIFVRSRVLNELGFVMDFNDLKQKLQVVLNEFDHSLLNQLPYFSQSNPTAENIAGVIMTKLSEFFEHEDCWPHQVRVYESDRSSASVFSNSEEA